MRVCIIIGPIFDLFDGTRRVPTTIKSLFRNENTIDLFDGTRRVPTTFKSML